jgi:hypothetical protein
VFTEPEEPLGMSFHIEFQLQPDQPKPGEPMSLYANVTLTEDTRCEAYQAIYKFTHPSGHVDEETKHCNSLDPHSGEWHLLIESFNPNEVGTYDLDLSIWVNSEFKAHAHHAIHIQ